MMNTRDTSSESDVLYQFALSYGHPDAQQLDEFVRRHPRYADSLTTLAIELALDQVSSEVDEAMATRYVPNAATGAMLARAMSRFQNRLHEVRSTQTQATAPRAADLAERHHDPFASRTSGEMQIIVQKLDASPVFVMRLRDRGIDVETMPSGFIRRVAEILGESMDAMTSYFAAPAQLRANTFFKSAVAPAAGRKLSFEEAVRMSGLTPEQQAQLLNL
jgi:hypothetical protein